MEVLSCGTRLRAGGLSCKIMREYDEEPGEALTRAQIAFLYREAQRLVNKNKQDLDYLACFLGQGNEMQRCRENAPDYFSIAGAT